VGVQRVDVADPARVSAQWLQFLCSSVCQRNRMPVFGSGPVSTKTIFRRIIDRELSADIVFEDDRCLAFRDINPQAPVHVLVIPKQEVRSVNDIADQDKELIGHLYAVVRDLARQLGVAGSGYRVVVNCGTDAGQTVDHLHLHLLGGRGLGWPPG
jgi:histidine triad (HIT) family protein